MGELQVSMCCKIFNLLFNLPLVSPPTLWKYWNHWQFLCMLSLTWCLQYDTSLESHSLYDLYMTKLPNYLQFWNVYIYLVQIWHRPTTSIFLGYFHLICYFILRLHYIQNGNIVHYTRLQFNKAVVTLLIMILCTKYSMSY